MFDFVWHLRGSVALKAFTTNEVALDGVKCLLSKQRKPLIEQGPDHLVFDDPFWSIPFGISWPAMFLYDHGTFRIERGPKGSMLRYDLRSLHGMAYCLLLALVFFLFIFASSGAFFGGLKFGALVFAWFYGGHMLMALSRVPSAIRGAVAVD